MGYWDADDMGFPPPPPMSTTSSTQSERDKAIKAAEDAGFEVIIATEKQLSLDLDGGVGMNQDVYKKLVEKLGETPRMEGWLSKSGRGRHLLLTFEKNSFSEAEAVALESALGSDPVRTLFGTLRAKNGVDKARLLFRPTDQMSKEMRAEFEKLDHEQLVQVFSTQVRLLESQAAA